MTDLIRRADALAYPIRIDHYDREHGNLHFVLGIESVMEYIENLPSAELVLQTPQTYGKSINPSNAEVVADYISRAEAIEAVNLMEVFLGEGKMEAVKRGIEALPSAEAVSLEEYEEVKAYMDTLVDAFIEDGKELASAEAVQGWIPCSERLPLVSGEFLVTLVDHDGTWVSTAQWNTTFGGRWQDIFPNDGYRDISNVIAWKTLPTPYTKEDSE